MDYIASEEFNKQPTEVHPNGLITKPRGNERLVPYEPSYKVGDVLYIRETWTTIDDFQNYADVEIDKDLKYLYKCDDNGVEHTFIDVGVKRWRPSIHTPKEAARIFLKVTDVRVERLQTITEDGAIKEGFNEVPELFTARELFEAEWNSIYKNWDENPWVWVIEFEIKEIKNREGK
ncbi:MAG: hypothetical protein Q8936_01850 [Bacillota bacterium]|nr:hypothetical protein [Bacillota bacterium]